MGQSLSNISLHIIFSTKRREPWLEDVALRDELCAYMATVLRGQECPASIINGVEDHLHVLCQLSRKLAVMDVIKEAKTSTSRWVKKRSADLRHFAWQNGYGVFSVSPSNAPEVHQYIADQIRHHQTQTFQDEMRAMCRRHRVELDERFAWD